LPRDQLDGIVRPEFHCPEAPGAEDRCLAGSALLGTLVKFTPGGRVLPEVDLRAYEGEFNPDHGIDESNPFAVLAPPGAELVTDAGGNSLLRVEANGDISTIATFPSRVNGRSTDAVPTGVDWTGRRVLR
jgi:hypothetical protein